MDLLLLIIFIYILNSERMKLTYNFILSEFEKLYKGIINTVP